MQIDCPNKITVTGKYLYTLFTGDIETRVGYICWIHCKWVSDWLFKVEDSACVQVFFVALFWIQLIELDLASASAKAFYRGILDKSVYLAAVSPAVTAAWVRGVVVVDVSRLPGPQQLLISAGDINNNTMQHRNTFANTQPQ